MEDQKIKSLLKNANNQRSKFKTRNTVEVNGDTHGDKNTNNQIKFKTMMLKSSVSDYSNLHTCKGH